MYKGIVVAPNHRQYEHFLRTYNLSRRDYLYGHSRDSIQGLDKDTLVILVEPCHAIKPEIAQTVWSYYTNIVHEQDFKQYEERRKKTSQLKEFAAFAAAALLIGGLALWKLL